MMTPFQHWYRENSSRFTGQILFDEPMSRHTYYRIGGPASIFVTPKSIEELHWLAEAIRFSGIPVFILGAGSNLLVADSGFRGLVVKTTRLNLDLMEINSVTIRTGGSVLISTLLRRAAQEGWAGLDFLTGIPGTVGGVVTMNGGTHLGEAKDGLTHVEMFPLLGASAGEGFLPIIYEKPELKYQYRANLFLPEGAVVWAAHWNIKKESPSKVKVQIDEVLTRRKATQPLDAPSCGSVFKNPKESGMSAWQVIEKVGLRGHQIGGARFSEKHSNFILNTGGATASNVKALIDLAKKKAKEQLGIQLQEEVKFLGKIE